MWLKPTKIGQSYRYQLAPMRRDHTAWLIHFVRDRIPSQDFPFWDGDDYGDSHVVGELEPDASAFAVLKTIIRLGGLIPGRSFRRGRTTVYGGQPVVCVTEMPLYSFALYARQQAHQKNVSAYGIAFLKAEFYAAGGRPVIYGLASEDVTYTHNDPYQRIFHDHILPRSEQYRYVAYNPSGDRWIDWSHEREWRWRVRDEDEEYVWSTDGRGCYGPIPGLPLLKGRSNGAHFTKLCIIVWSRGEATEIQQLLTGYYLAGYNNYSTPFDKAVIANSRIIVLQEVIEAVEKNGNLDAQTIEGLEDADLVTPIVLSIPPPDAAQVIATAFAAATHAGQSTAKAYIAKYPKDGDTADTRMPQPMM